jgi:DNA (cytosine-5)-methyltransferase 1
VEAAEGVNYYGDNDRGVCAWLRELIAAGLIPKGVVDERPIQEVRTSDLAGYQHVGLFCGIAGWQRALDLAGWPADRPVWTASCPCQPFSSAGKGKGEADARHLWPHALRLVRECRPATVFGEQVASSDGYHWLARVRDDLEEAGYAVGCADLPAACVGAPHIRQRLFWVAVSEGQLRRGHAGNGQQGVGGQGGTVFGQGCSTGRLGEPNRPGREQHGRSVPDKPQQSALERTGDAGRVAFADGRESGNGDVQRVRQYGQQQEDGRVGFWSAFDLLPCSDGKVRRVEPGLQCLVDGVPFRLADGRTREGTSRVGLLRGFGNAIAPAIAALFIKAFLEAEAEGMKL